MLDVSLHRGEEEPLSVELALNTIPEAKSSQTGESVEYVPDPNKQWYVLRSMYGRAQKGADMLIDKGIYVYIAKQYVRRFIKGKMKRTLKPLIPNIIFSYSTEDEMDRCMKDLIVSEFVNYYYDHCQKKQDGKNPPLTVKEDEMYTFIKLTSTLNEHMKFVEAERCHYKMGDRVRVIDGPFQGIEGRVARVAGQQRVVITLSNFGLISTAYVPSAFLFKLL